jgi:hypothetical protein
MALSMSLASICTGAATDDAAGVVRGPEKGEPREPTSANNCGRRPTSPTSWPAPGKPRRNTATTPALRAAEADNATDVTERDRLRDQAGEASALADALDARSAELEAVDDARARWYAHTAETRAAADRARAELSARQAADADDSTDRAVSGDEWLAAHQAATLSEDPLREITTDHDLADIVEARDRDHAAEAGGQPDIELEDQRPPVTADQAGMAAELDSAPRDIRQQAADEPARADGHDPDAVRVPSAEQTAESVRRAQRALVELRQRQAIEQRRVADEARDEELARWHATDDATTDTTNSRCHSRRRTGGLDPQPRRPGPRPRR